MRRKYCGVKTTHHAHAWSADDLSENEHFHCSGVKPIGKGDVVQIGQQKYRVAEVVAGRAALVQRGKWKLNIYVAEVEYHKIPGLWRPVNARA